MSHPLSLSALTACALTLPGSGEAPQQPDTDTVDERVAAIVSAAIGAGECSGVSLRVTLDGDALVEGGWGAAAGGARAGARALYPAEAMLDPWVRTAVLSLVDEGEWQLESPLGELLEGWEEASEVQLVHLLGHTSGLPDLDALPRAVAESQGEAFRSGVIRELSEAPLLSTPGTCYEPGSVETLLLGWMLEEATGETLEEVLQARVFGPAGMESTGFGEEYDPRRGSEDGPREASSRAGSRLFTNVEDLLRWQRALVEGELLSDAATRGMLEPSSPADRSGIEHGFGLRRSYLGDRSASSFGADGGEYGIHLAHYPSFDLSLALMARGEAHELDRIGRRIVRSIFDLPEPNSQTRPITGRELERYTGRYNVGCSQIRIRAEEGHLILDGFDYVDLRLGYQGQHGFLALADLEVRLTFELDRGGRASSFVLEDAGVHSSGVRVE